MQGYFFLNPVYEAAALAGAFTSGSVALLRLPSLNAEAIRRIDEGYTDAMRALQNRMSRHLRHILADAYFTDGVDISMQAFVHLLVDMMPNAGMSEVGKCFVGLSRNAQCYVSKGAMNIDMQVEPKLDMLFESFVIAAEPALLATGDRWPHDSWHPLNVNGPAMVRPHFAETSDAVAHDGYNAMLLLNGDKIVAFYMPKPYALDGEVYKAPLTNSTETVLHSISLELSSSGDTVIDKAVSERAELVNAVQTLSDANLLLTKLSKTISEQQKQIDILTTALAKLSTKPAGQPAKSIATDELLNLFLEAKQSRGEVNVVIAQGAKPDINDFVLPHDIVADVNIGNVYVGQSFKAGTQIVSIIEKMLGL